VSVQKIFVSPFYHKPRPSGVNLQFSGLENIPYVPENRAELGQNQDAPKAVSATLSVLKWSGPQFRPISSKVSVQKVLLCPFYCKPRPSRLSLESPGLENNPQVPENWAKVAQNHDARKAVSATISFLKWSGAIFRLRSSQVSVQKALLCPLHCKPKPSGVNLESPGLENNPQLPGNRAKVAQNQDAFRPRRSTPSVRSFCLCPFH